MDTILPLSLDEYLKYTSIGSLKDAGSNSLYGFKRSPGMAPIPRNNDDQGYCFFTRPQLNLQTGNLINNRIFYPYLTPGSDAEDTIQRFARCTLDPRLMRNVDKDIEYKKSSLVDKSNGFIPILTNSLKTMTGFAPLQVKEWSSKAGLYGEEYSIVDSSLENFSKGTMSCTFVNTRADPIVHIFYLWLWYMTLEFEGFVVKYPDFYSENTIDYMSRIYRLNLDSNRRVVTKIAATGVCYPTSLDVHEFFDYDSSKRHNEATNELSVSFTFLGQTFLDDLLIYDFNRVSSIFTDKAIDKPKKENRKTVNGLTYYEVSKGERELIKIPPVLTRLMENRGTPYIDTNTYELEWWVSAAYFDTIIERYVAGDTLGILAAESRGFAMDRTIVPSQANVNIVLDPYYA